MSETGPSRSKQHQDYFTRQYHHHLSMSLRRCTTIPNRTKPWLEKVLTHTKMVSLSRTL